MAENGNTIIIKRVKKGGHGHHGGAWKVAYADFVTAMMAFFLLLWLLNSVTEEQLEGISNYFAPITTATTTSGAGDILAGRVVGEEGALENMASRPNVAVDLPPPKAGQGGASPAGQETADPDAVSEKQIEEFLRETETREFQEAADALRQAIENVPQLKQLAKSLIIDDTPEGLRIQIVDQDGLAMFPRGSSEMYLHTRRLLEQVAKIIQQTRQDLSISGHTDAVPFISEGGYSNWELSADRANAARRWLINYGVAADRVTRVVGRAETDPLFPDDPEGSGNRRLSVVLLRGTGEVPVTPQVRELPSVLR